MNLSLRNDLGVRCTHGSTKINLKVIFLSSYVIKYSSALLSFNDLIAIQLIDMLMFNQREPVDLEVREPSVEPCWIDSLDESRSSFLSAIEQMHCWFEFMSDQIIRLKAIANISPLEVSRYGKTKNFQT